MGQAGRAGVSVRARQHGRALRAAAAAPARRLDDASRWAGTRGPPRCPGARAARDADSTSPSGIPRWWCTTGYGWEEHPLYPGGEFYGEFGSLHRGPRRARGSGRRRDRRARLRRSGLGARQPEPGSAGRVPARLLRRRPRRPADACAGAEPGRKRIRWYAERVHHFAMSLNPAYRYEGGHFGNVAIHVLYQPGDETTWGGGVAVRAHADGARLARPALRAVRLAADHQRAPDRGRRHRVPDDGSQRLGGSGTHRPRGGPQLHDGPARQQRVARGVAGRGVHQLPDELVLGDDGQGELRRHRGGGALARPRRLLRAAQPGGARPTATSPPTTSPSTPAASCSSTSSAPSWATPRCTGSSGRSTSAGSTTTWTRRRSGPWPRRVSTATSRPSSRSGCTRPSCTTTRWAASTPRGGATAG